MDESEKAKIIKWLKDFHEAMMKNPPDITYLRGLAINSPLPELGMLAEAMLQKLEELRSTKVQLAGLKRREEKKDEPTESTPGVR